MGNDEMCSKDKLTGDSKYEKTCERGLDTCMRSWSKKGDTIAVINSCTAKGACKIAEDACKNYDGDGECAVACCTSDLCNAGSSVSFSVFLMTVCSVLGLALLK